jgi:hypothetical protein
MISGLTLLAVTAAVIVAAHAGAPIHEMQISAPKACAKMPFRTRKLWPFLARYDVRIKPKWLIFGQPWFLR